MPRWEMLLRRTKDSSDSKSLKTIKAKWQDILGSKRLTSKTGNDNLSEWMTNEKVNLKERQKEEPKDICILKHNISNIPAWYTQGKQPLG